MVMSAHTVNCVIVSNAAVKKTQLLLTYTTRHIWADDEYVPVVFDNYSPRLVVDNVPVNLGLFDTKGMEDYDRIRALSYPNTDCFLICYSLESHNSLQEVYDKWIPEIRVHCPKVPVILAGLKTDLPDDPESLRDDEREHHGSKSGKEMAKIIGAVKFFECSLKNLQSLDEIFEEVVRASLQNKGLLPKNKILEFRAEKSRNKFFNLFRKTKKIFLFFPFFSQKNLKIVKFLKKLL